MIRYNKNNGFTLIELMIVVVIIGILAAMAIPRFMAATTKTKQTEARALLKQIYVNQRTYRQQSTTNSYYITPGVASSVNPQAFKDIWIEVMVPARYSYTITGDATSFVATATGNIDDDATIDTWTIDDTGLLQNTIDDVTT